MLDNFIVQLLAPTSLYNFFCITCIFCICILLCILYCAAVFGEIKFIITRSDTVGELNTEHFEEKRRGAKNTNL